MEAVARLSFSGTAEWKTSPGRMTGVRGSEQEGGFIQAKSDEELSRSLSVRKNTNINIQYDQCKVQISLTLMDIQDMLLFWLQAVYSVCHSSAAPALQRLTNWIFTFVLN